MRGSGLQSQRLLFQAGFFLLFIVAPPLDILRVDLTPGDAVLPVVAGRPHDDRIEPNVPSAGPSKMAVPTRPATEGR